MKIPSSILCVGIAASLVSTPAARAVTDSAPASAIQPLIERIDSVHLVDNRVYLDRQAADALATASPSQAAQLLLHALSDLDSAQATIRVQKVPDPRRLAELDFTRRPVLLQLVRIDPAEGLRALEQPQSADSDTEFQRLVFEQIAATDPSSVSDLALRKLGHGVTPSVVAAYAVLQDRDPAGARVLVNSIIARLGKQDGQADPEAVRQSVQSAFALLRLLRVDQGTRAPRIVLNPALIDDQSIGTLFTYIADAFLNAKEPELLVLPESPKLYIQAIEDYAPAKAQQVKALPFAAPDAKSIIFSRAKIDDGQPDAAPQAPLTPEQQQRNARRQEQYSAQLRETAAQFTAVKTTLADATMKEDQREKSVWSAVEAANKSIALGRSYAGSLQPSEFLDGEYAFSHQGPITGVLDSLAGILQGYAAQHPDAAVRAAEGLDSSEMQIMVELKLTSAMPRYAASTVALHAYGKGPASK